MKNIVLCTCDQLRAFEVGCYGNNVIRTPNIDALAARGVRFETAITPYPVCMAARSALLSGQYPRRCTGGAANFTYPGAKDAMGMPEYPFAGRPHLPDPTLPELLRERGYYNAAIGKWHIHSWPHDIGFDEYTIPRVHHCHSAQHFTRNGGPEFVPDGWSVDFELDCAEQFFVQRAQEEKPFFLYFNLSPPHCPISDGPDKYTQMYRPEEIPLRANVDLNVPIKDEEHWLKVYRWDFRYYGFHLPYTEELPDDYDLLKAIAEYYGMTTWVDDALGRLVNAIEQQGLSEETIVIFTSDHGDNLGSHGLVQKGGLNEEAIRIPLIMRVPGLQNQRVIEEQVANLVDVMPTLLDLCGGEVPSHPHGRSLAPVLRGERAHLEMTGSFVETGGDGVGIRTPQHFYGLPWQNKPELGDRPHYFHDLHADPCQMQMLNCEGDNSEIAVHLDEELRRWHAATH